MFKSARWWSEKAKIEIVFKLQFHATQVAELNVDALMIFVVPADIGKESARLEKTIVRDGVCKWKTPAYETVKFVKEQKTGKIKEKLYHFVISTGVSKSCVIGTASIDFADYASTTKACTVSLPLKYSKSKALLHVTIQKRERNANLSDVEQTEDTKSENRDGSLKSYLSNGDIDGSIENNSTQDGHLNKTTNNAELNFNYRPSSLSCMTTMSSDSSSGLDTPREPGTRTPNKQAANGLNGVDEEEHRRSQWDWSEGSDLGMGTDDSTNSSQERSHQASDDEVDKLKAEVVLFSRRADFLDLELQTLRKQIVKESKGGQDLTKEVVLLKHERDAFQAECHKLRGLNSHAESKHSLRSDGGDPQTFLEETKEELNHEKELNSNLRLQLQKTQDSNAELLLAIQDLDEMLKEKDREISNLSKKKLGSCDRAEQSIGSVSRTEPDDDEEQKALEDIVKDHRDAKQTYLLEQHIMDLETEVDIYRRDKEELEIQIEQLALDYEILKQENHDMSYKLEQSKLQEQLKLQYECSGNINELETQIENLENELEKQSKDFSDSLATIKDLEAHIKALEEEMEKQAQGFEADLESVTDSKVKQEQRAIRAEQALRMAKQKNAHTAERLQEDLRILSEKMASTFDANEKVAIQALAEASELRLQNGQLQDMLKKTYEELQSVKDELHELSNQLEMKKKHLRELLDKSKQLEQQKRHAEEIRVAHSQETLKLKAEIERLRIENNLSAKQAEQIQKLEYEIEQMKISIGETEVALQRRSMERNSLAIVIALLKKDSKNMAVELNRFKRLKDENERAIGLLQSQLATFQLQSKDLKRSLADDELEKEKLRKQMFQLKDDLNKKEDALTSTEMKLKECNGRVAITKSSIRSNKTAPVPVSSKEVTILKEKLKLLDGQIKSKEAALETSTNSFLEKEKELKNKIEELESRLGELSRSSTSLFDDQFQKEAAGTVENGGNLDELLSEVAEIKEKNTELENELKEMQERYSEISLKFAEVEGERQQLVMTVRSLKNAKNKKT